MSRVGGGAGSGAHLNLLVLEDTVDAAVEGRPREHGGDRVREVQHRLQHRSHALGVKGRESNRSHLGSLTRRFSGVLGLRD